MIDATTAAELIAEIRARGGRVHRYQETRVFVLTRDPELVKDLIGLGGAYAHGQRDGYNTAFVTKDGAHEWDIDVHQIERPAVTDEDTGVETAPARFPGIWEAAAKPRHLHPVP